MQSESKNLDALGQSHDMQYGHDGVARGRLESFNV